jgi:hypothetical protein
LLPFLGHFCLHLYTNSTEAFVQFHLKQYKRSKTTLVFSHIV